MDRSPWRVSVEQQFLDLEEKLGKTEAQIWQKYEAFYFVKPGSVFERPNLQVYSLLDGQLLANVGVFALIFALWV